MDKSSLLEILEDWNFWKKEMETGVERTDYVEKCLRFLKTNVIVGVIGVRRSGKSYIMRQAIRKLIERGTDRKDVLMVNFEDRRFADYHPKLLDEVYDTYLEVLKPGRSHFVILDEVQNVPEWERWVRTMHELGKAKIVVSGSSSKLLSGELATVLTGRHLDILVSPLSFKEFLRFKNIEIRNQVDIVASKVKIKTAFNEYVEFGGFPEVVLSEDKKQLLLTYFDDILTKDIERRYKLKETEKLRALTRFYFTNISNTITFNSIRKFLSTSTNTIEKFSSYLEEANILFFVKRFSFKVKEQEKAARKVYATDIGLANAVGFKSSQNIGKIAENIVAAEIKRRATTSGEEVYYWQDYQKKEVDFVVKKGLKIRQLIQVSWDISEYKTKEREIKALHKASRELKCNNLLVITGGYEAEEAFAGKKISFLPLWKWVMT
ncbi:ATP-binding protein [Candidatus Woesearchaeota archaeon]|nr:ATP-binding protein [Candidatus Woesearchaeota archaeon]